MSSVVKCVIYATTRQSQLYVAQEGLGLELDTAGKLSEKTCRIVDCAWVLLLEEHL